MQIAKKQYIAAQAANMSAAPLHVIDADDWVNTWIGHLCPTCAVDREKILNWCFEFKCQSDQARSIMMEKEALEKDQK